MTPIKLLSKKQTGSVPRSVNLASRFGPLSKKIFRGKLLILSALLCLVGTKLYAEPMEFRVDAMGESSSTLLFDRSGILSPPGVGPLLIDGLTISWPSDGWYQVQSATDYWTLCEGGTSCTVSPGNYIVTNHTTGQRYEPVVVSGEETDEQTSPNDLPSGVTVTDGVIEWTGPGWVQVQRVDDYTAVCQGGSSCAVEDGTYNLINHASGERVNDIVVVDGMGSIGGEGSTSADGGSQITITENVISWVETGWFQVLDGPTFSVVCEGEISSCTVEDGTYIVINHTSGERFEPIVVGDEG